jgi:ABC-2 type transport system permease protein
VPLPATSVRRDVRAVKIVVHRELIRFLTDHTRTIASLFQPLLFLFVLGTGLSSLVPGGSGDVDMRTYMFPGVIALSVMFTALFSAVTIVWDREFGFLREMLVAPVRRGSIVIGKCLGGTLVATLQGTVILAMAPLAGVPYEPTLMLTLIGETALLSFTLTAFGMVTAVRMKATQSFMTLVQMFTMPMFFLSGAVFPLTNLPDWLHVLTLINPLTYAIDPMRRAVFDHLEVSEAANRIFNQGVTWGDWQVPVGVEIAIVGGTGLLLLGVAVAQFRRD